MFAVSVVYPSGKVKLLGFAGTPKEVDSIIEKILTANGGKEKVEQLGVRFNAELAM